MKYIKALTTFILVFTFSCANGDDSNVSMENYEKIKIGMTKNEVENILTVSGKQAIDTNSKEVVTIYGIKNFAIVIQYNNKKVSEKNYLTDFRRY